MIKTIFVIAVLAIIATVICSRQINHKNEVDEESLSVKPQFKHLSEEQIQDIHSRGKLTPEEAVKEWESFDLCTPGDSMSRAKNRCKKFEHNCHDCLVDYANGKDEYDPIDLSIIHYPY